MLSGACLGRRVSDGQLSCLSGLIAQPGPPQRQSRQLDEVLTELRHDQWDGPGSAVSPHLMHPRHRRWAEHRLPLGCVIIDGAGTVGDNSKSAVQALKLPAELHGSDW